MLRVEMIVPWMMARYNKVTVKQQKEIPATYGYKNGFENPDHCIEGIDDLDYKLRHRASIKQRVCNIYGWIVSARCQRKPVVHTQNQLQQGPNFWLRRSMVATHATKFTSPSSRSTSSKIPRFSGMPCMYPLAFKSWTLKLLSRFCFESNPFYEE